MTRTMRTFNFIFSLTLAALLAGAASAHAADVLPERLSQTGLYADIAAKQIAPGVLSFSPQYPLWSDGARKQRWIALPPGTSVDASDPDAWVFPVGTRLWKEFAFDRRIETRFLELTAAGWAFATYRWLDDESDAVLAAKLGERAVYRLPDGVAYDLPARSDCRACHEGNVSGVLGFSALQLSGARDPGALHSEPLGPGDLDLASLVARGLVRGLPASLVANPPRIAASSPAGRAALGYLHGNCAMCHNAAGPLADLGLDLEQRVAAPSAGLAGALAEPTRLFQVPGVAAGRSLRLAPGDPEHSAIVARLGSRRPSAQMPPLGTKLVDEEAVRLVSRWIAQAGVDRRGPTATRVSSKEE